MRVKLLIATVDIVYAKLISDNISEHHASIIDVSICSALENLQDTLSKRRYNVALIDMEMIEHLDTSSIHMPLLLWSENENVAGISSEFETINKHQRISSIVATILERYAKISENKHLSDSRQANIVAVWSPAGGVGKTTVAIAYALSLASEGKEVFYLNLENFSSVPGFFNETGKSISAAFEMLENHDGDVKMLVQGIRCRDYEISYLCGPDNFDDMCILSVENITELIMACAELADELVIDLSCICDVRAKKAFEFAQRVLIVKDQSETSEVKLTQFLLQNNVFESINEKIALVANKGVAIKEMFSDTVISLPYVQSSSNASVCKTLSENDCWRDF